MNAQWTYMDAQNRVVAREVGGRVESTLASALPQGTEVLPYVAIAEPVPKTVSAFQGCEALRREGLLPTVVAYMNSPSAPPQTKLAWERAGDWEFDSPSVNAMCQLLGLNTTQKNQLFVTAKGIKA